MTAGSYVFIAVILAIAWLTLKWAGQVGGQAGKWTVIVVLALCVLALVLHFDVLGAVLRR